MKPEEIGVFWDSWAAGLVAGSEFEGSYLDVLGISEENRMGVCGTSAAWWANDETGKLQKMLNSSTRTWLMWIGGNDLLTLIEHKKHVVPDDWLQVKDNIRRILELCSLWGKQLCIGIYPDCLLDDTMKLEVDRMNRVLLLATSFLVWPRQAPKFFVPGLTREHFEPGDMHPTKQGHWVLAQEFTEFLAAAAFDGGNDDKDSEDGRD